MNGQGWNPDALLIYDVDADNTRLTIEPNGLGINRGSNSISHGLDVGGTAIIRGNSEIQGNLTISGTVDGRDVAADGTKLDTYAANGSSYLRSDADDSFTGTITATSDTTNPVLLIKGIGPNFIRFDSGDDPSVSSDSIDLIYRANPNTLGFERVSDSQTLFSVDADTAVFTIQGNLDANNGIDTTNITVTGTVDGVDIAALNTTVGTKLPLAGGTITGNVIHNDSVKAIFGTDSDFSIYHSSNTTLENETTGGHLILNNKATLGSIRLRVANGEEGIVVNPNGQVEVYCDNALKLNTHTSGVTVTGTCTATAFSGDGSNLSGVGAFPSGTKMLFQQTSAPTGWTKVTSSVDNRALRVVSGSAGSGGSVAFTTAFASQSVSGSVANTTAGGSISTNNTTAGGSVSSHTLSTSQIPSHSHSLPRGDQNWGNGNSGHNTIWGSSYIASTGSTGGGGSHNHGFSGSAHSHSGSFSGSAHNHSFSGTSINLAVQYIDVIVASKD